METTIDRSKKNQVILEVFDEKGNFVVRREFTNSRTAAGAVAVSNILFTTGAQPAAFNYVALSSNASFTPVYTDTTLSTEITTLGLARKQGTFTVAGSPASFNATGATVISASWTVTGTITVYGAGLLNASSAGTLGFEATCTATPVANGYTLNLSWTLNE